MSILTFILRDRAFTYTPCYPLPMPARPRWHADLDRIRSTVAALGAPLIDRQAIEQLFGVRPRQANNLMRGLGGYCIGSAAVVCREDLLLQLDQMAGPRGYAAQAKCKARVVESLDDLRRNLRPRRVAPRPHRFPTLPCRPAPASRPPAS
jgi:hypothetical protein